MRSFTKHGCEENYGFFMFQVTEGCNEGCLILGLRKYFKVKGSILCFSKLGIKSEPTRSIVVNWVKIFKTEKTIEIQIVRPTEVCGKVLSEKKRPISSLKQHCYCPMRTIKTAVCLQTKAIFQHLYGF